MERKRVGIALFDDIEVLDRCQSVRQSLCLGLFYLFPSGRYPHSGLALKNTPSLIKGFS